MGTAASIHANIHCQHCQQKIQRSCVVEESCESIQMMCTACGEEYKLKNNFDQRCAMSKKPWRPFCEEQIINANQIGPGDVIGFKEMNKKGAFDYKHTVLLIQWDSAGEEGSVAELNAVPLRGQVKIDKNKIDLEELEKQLAYVARYQPLDCLPLKETLRRASESIGKVLDEKDTCLSTAANFVSWCKCGRVKKK